ncbi:MAG: DUF3187 family protein, partial [Thermoanaerobaculia bacterium]|nr:DUF3187 family protein [Thermoanaerobaculia bacterium]
RLETGFGLDLEDGEWAQTISVTQFNAWDVSWHTRARHRDLGRQRERVLGEELRYIEEAFPDDNAWHIDLEGWRTDLYVSRGIGDLTLSAAIPWIEIGGPNWDKFAEGFHSTFGLNRLGREQFPRSETFLYLKSAGNETIIEARDGLNRSGLGDVTFAVGAPLGERWHGTHQVVGTVQAPLGESGTLLGSGGWDLGVTWYGTWRGSVSTYKLAAGYTWLDPGGSFLGTDRSEHLGHLLLDIDRPLWFGFHGSAGVRIDSSPLLEVMEADPGYPATFYRFSLLREVAGTWVGFTFGNALLPQTGLEADWTVSLTAGNLLH